jgi:hypothetical protein
LQFVKFHFGVSDDGFPVGATGDVGEEVSMDDVVKDVVVVLPLAPIPAAPALSSTIAREQYRNIAEFITVSFY